MWLSPTVPSRQLRLLYAKWPLWYFNASRTQMKNRQKLFFLYYNSTSHMTVLNNCGMIFSLFKCKAAVFNQIYFFRIKQVELGGEAYQLAWDQQAPHTWITHIKSETIKFQWIFITYKQICVFVLKGVHLFLSYKDS